MKRRPKPLSETTKMRIELDTKTDSGLPAAGEAESASSSDLRSEEFENLHQENGLHIFCHDDGLARAAAGNADRKCDCAIQLRNDQGGSKSTSHSKIVMCWARAPLVSLGAAGFLSGAQSLMMN